MREAFLLCQGASIHQMFQKLGQSRTFQSILADNAYNAGWEAANRKQLINRIKRKLKGIYAESFKP